MVLRRSGIDSDGISRSDGEQRERPPYAALNCRWGGNQSAAVVAGVAEPECPSRRMRVDHILPLSRLGRCNGTPSAASSLEVENAGHRRSGRPARGEGRAHNSHGHPGGGDHDQLERIELAPERAARQGEACYSSQGID